MRREDRSRDEDSSIIKGTKTTSSKDDDESGDEFIAAWERATHLRQSDSLLVRQRASFWKNRYKMYSAFSAKTTKSADCISSILLIGL